MGEEEAGATDTAAIAAVVEPLAVAVPGGVMVAGCGDGGWWRFSTSGGSAQVGRVCYAR